MKRFLICILIEILLIFYGASPLINGVNLPFEISPCRQTIALADAYQTVNGTVQPQTSQSQTLPTVFARAIVHDAYFFASKDSSTSLFAVPYTYCVQTIRDEGDWYYCKYAEDLGVYRAIYGYCRKSDFIAVEGFPKVTYLYKPLTITFTADNATATLPVLGELTVQAAFYGTYYSGASAYSYVLCEGSFGYISGANDDYPLNEIKTEPQKQDPETSKENDETNSQLITALVLIALASVAVILLFATTRKQKLKDGS